MAMLESVVPTTSFAKYFADRAIQARLVEDHERAQLFRAAMTALIRPEDWVLDLGAGMGVLSQIALELGAARVVAVEQNAGIFPTDEPTFANALASGQLTLVEMPSSEWDGADCLGQIDVIVSETIGTFGINEGILPTMSDGQRRFLKPGGVTIPTVVGLDITLHPRARGQAVTPHIDFDPIGLPGSIEQQRVLSFPLCEDLGGPWSGHATFEVPTGDWHLLVCPTADLGANTQFTGKDVPRSFGRATIPLGYSSVQRMCHIELMSDSAGATAKIETEGGISHGLQFDWRFH